MFDTQMLLDITDHYARLDVVDCADDELFHLALTIESARTSLDAATGHVLAELQFRNACDRTYGLSTAAWYAREARVDHRTATTRVKVAGTLRNVLVDVDAALVARRITFDHARVLARACTPRIADDFAPWQPVLLDLADGLRFDRWRTEVNGLADLLDQDGAHDPNHDLARNRLTISETIDGVRHLSGTFEGENALLAQQLIERVADELFHQYVADNKVSPDLAVPSRPTLRALAFLEICRRALAVTPDGTTRAPAPEVTIVVRAADPADPDGEDLVTDPQGVRLPDGTTRRLRCCGDIYALIVDHLGVPLDMGRRLRLANRQQRRALANRDGGCVFPGCSAPARWSDAHHHSEYRHGGETNIKNLVLLCRRHHGVTHRTGWHLHATPDGWFWWTSPSGHTFWSQRHGQQRAGPTPPIPTDKKHSDST